MANIPSFTLTADFITPQRVFHPRAWLYFLSRMERGCNITNLDGWKYWDALLGKPRHQAMQEFIDEGLLRAGEHYEKIVDTHTIADLKKIASAHNIKLPSKKAGAVAQLFDAIPREMQRRADRLGYVYCTPKGKDVLMGYYREEGERYLSAQSEALSHLEDGNLTDAIGTARRYWETQVFRRGNFGGDDSHVMAVLGGILGGPYAHADKMAAGILYLLSGDYPGKWAVEKQASKLI